MSATDGGPAFPCSNEQFTYGNPATGDAFPGMSLRDWFAGQVVQAYMAWQLNLPCEPGDTKEIAAARYASTAYCIADAMLKARQP